MNNMFINEAFTMAISEYMNWVSKPASVQFNSFYVVVIRTLILLYGEVDIINPFKTMNEKGMGGFDVNLGKFGYPISDINQFKVDFNNFYVVDIGQQGLPIKKKNPFLVEVQKDLVDMFYCKAMAGHVSSMEEQMFYSLLYTMENRNTYMKSFNLLYATDPREVSRYLNSRVFQIMNRFSLKPLIMNRLDFAIYNHFGITNEIVMAWNQSQVDSVNKQIFDYVQTGLNDPELLNKMNSLLSSRRKPRIEIVY